MFVERSQHEKVTFRSLWVRVKEFPWRNLIIFMIGWSFLGYYAVPFIKEVQGKASLSENDRMRAVLKLQEARAQFEAKKAASEPPK